MPKLAKKLLSVSQLTDQFSKNCEFSNINFCVKERVTDHVIMNGKRKGDLYVFSDPHELHFSNRFKRGTEKVWHQHLGHPQTFTLQLIKNKGLIEVLGDENLGSVYVSY